MRLTVGLVLDSGVLGDVAFDDGDDGCVEFVLFVLVEVVFEFESIDLFHIRCVSHY